ncbi:MAG: threonine synthase, partial [Planctomycetes bacterium]|nr:threonine synthase [Planctomycetota bacterium]
KLIERGIIKSNERVVVISTAHGLKFPEFKIRYHENRLPEVTARYTNLPVELPPDYEAVKGAIFKRLEGQFH